MNQKHDISADDFLKSLQEYEQRLAELESPEQRAKEGDEPQPDPEERMRVERELLDNLIRSALRDEDIRLAKYAAVLAGASEADQDLRDRIFVATKLHDIGDLTISEEILTKPGKLNSEEFEEIKKHTVQGYELLSGHQADILKLAAEIAFSHHENWDGTGYPRGLARKAIPLSGRIVRVCDTYAALTSDRPYRKAMSADEAMEVIGKMRGEELDPDLVDAFSGCLGEIQAVDASVD